MKQVETIGFLLLLIFQQHHILAYSSKSSELARGDGDLDRFIQINENFKNDDDKNFKGHDIGYITQPQLWAWTTSQRGKRKPPAMSVDLTLHTLRDMLRSKSGRNKLSRLRGSGRGTSRAHLSRAGKR